ncbi:MAG: TetR/AcrR family transcriptional regulator [Rhodobiaceae bacterium]|nr:TetR/AcrR family transcriptional regulator [Rhodobiaceae bacterium]
MAARKKTAKTPDPVDAFLELVAERGFDDVTIADVAQKCGLKLTEMRALYSDPFAILAAFSERIDKAVLDAVPDDLMEDAPRERIFDVLMMRFDALLPYKEAVSEIYEACRGNPLALAAWNRIAVKSQYWMLVAAGLPPKGPGGMLEAQALVVVFARAMRVWLKDDDPGMASTMAELDRRLREAVRLRRNAEGLMTGARRAFDIVSAIARGSGRRRRSRDDYDRDDYGETDPGAA